MTFEIVAFIAFVGFVLITMLYLHVPLYVERVRERNEFLKDIARISVVGETGPSVTREDGTTVIPVQVKFTRPDGTVFFQDTTVHSSRQKHAQRL